MAFEAAGGKKIENSQETIKKRSNSKLVRRGLRGKKQVKKQFLSRTSDAAIVPTAICVREPRLMERTKNSKESVTHEKKKRRRFS